MRVCLAVALALTAAGAALAASGTPPQSVSPGLELNIDRFCWIQWDPSDSVFDLKIDPAPAYRTGADKSRAKQSHYFDMRCNFVPQYRISLTKPRATDDPGIVAPGTWRAYFDDNPAWGESATNLIAGRPVDRYFATVEVYDFPLASLARSYAGGAVTLTVLWNAGFPSNSKYGKPVWPGGDDKFPPEVTLPVEVPYP